MDHSDHWACLEPDGDLVFERFVKPAVSEGEAVRGRMRRLAQQRTADGRVVDEPAIQTPTCIIWEPGPLGVRALVLPAQGGGTVLASVFPYSLTDRIVPMLVQDVETDETGLEGWVHAETLDGLPLSFLDLDFYKAGDRHPRGEPVAFRIGALAYSLRREPPQTVEVTDPEQIAVLHRVQGTPNDGLPFAVSTQGMAALLPVAKEGWLPFEYRVHGPVRARRAVSALGQEFQLLTITAMRGDGDFDLDLLAGPHIGAGGEPAQPGDDVGGHIWVHGRAAE